MLDGLDTGLAPDRLFAVDATVSLNMPRPVAVRRSLMGHDSMTTTTQASARCTSLFG